MLLKGGKTLSKDQKIPQSNTTVTVAKLWGNLFCGGELFSGWDSQQCSFILHSHKFLFPVLDKSDESSPFGCSESQTLPKIVIFLLSFPWSIEAVVIRFVSLFIRSESNAPLARL